MKKRTMLIVAGTAVTLASTQAFAQTMSPESEDRCSKVSMPGAEGCGLPPSQPKPAPVDWEAKQAEMMKKQAQMRMETMKYAKEKGVDVSGIAADFLDPAKTTEAEFWKAMEQAKRAHEAIGLKKKLEELRSQGYEITPDLEEYASSGNYAKFWPAVKALLAEGKEAPTGVCGDGTRCQWTPGMRDEEKRIQPIRPPMMMGSGAVRPGENRPNGMRDGNNGMGMGVIAPPTVRKNALSEKTRALLIAKLDAIPSDKRAIFYERAKALLEKKIAGAREAKQARAVAMLEEILKVIAERVGPDAQDETSVVEELFGNGTDQ